MPYFNVYKILSLLVFIHYFECIKVLNLFSKINLNYLIDVSISEIDFAIIPLICLLLNEPIIIRSIPRTS